MYSVKINFKRNIRGCVVNAMETGDREYLALAVYQKDEGDCTTERMPQYEGWFS